MISLEGSIVDLITPFDADDIDELGAVERGVLVFVVRIEVLASAPPQCLLSGRAGFGLVWRHDDIELVRCPAGPPELRGSGSGS